MQRRETFEETNLLEKGYRVMFGLLDDIEQIDFSDYSEMLFNLYEDEDAYTVEVVFDDDKLIIGRDDKRYVIEERNVDFNVVLKNVALILKTYFKEKKDKYKQFKSIAYGFVDGDLYYIKKPRKKKKELIHFSKEDFYSFDAFRVEAWLTVYLNAEGKEKYEQEVFETDFKKLSTEELHKWCEILALYFDYQKYYKNK